MTKNGKILPLWQNHKILANFLRTYFGFGIILNFQWLFFAVGQIFIAVNGQILNTWSGHLVTLVSTSLGSGVTIGITWNDQSLVRAARHESPGHLVLAFLTNFNGSIKPLKRRMSLTTLANRHSLMLQTRNVTCECFLLHPTLIEHRRTTHNSNNNTSLHFRWLQLKISSGCGDHQICNFQYF